MEKVRNLHFSISLAVGRLAVVSKRFSQTTLVSVESVKKANSTLVVANRSRIRLVLEFSSFQ